MTNDKRNAKIKTVYFGEAGALRETEDQEKLRDEHRLEAKLEGDWGTDGGANPDQSLVSNGQRANNTAKNGCCAAAADFGPWLCVSCGRRHWW